VTSTALLARHHPRMHMHMHMHMHEMHMHMHMHVQHMHVQTAPVASTAPSAPRPP